MVDYVGNHHRGSMEYNPGRSSFSFGRSDRFKSAGRRQLKKIDFLEMPSTLEKKGTSFGRGMRYDFTSPTKKEDKFNPSPGEYHLGSTFDAFTRGKKKTCLMGKPDSRYPNRLQPLDSSQEITPGPGEYSQKSTFGSSRRTILSGKDSKFKTIYPKNNAPGPGFYKRVDNSADIKYRNRGTTRFSTARRGELFAVNDSPSPSSYTSLSTWETGSSVLSQMKSNNSGKFSRANRDVVCTTSIDRDSPGPGDYSHHRHTDTSPAEMKRGKSALSVISPRSTSSVSDRKLEALFGERPGVMASALYRTLNSDSKRVRDARKFTISTSVLTKSRLRHQPLSSENSYHELNITSGQFLI